MTSAPSTVWPCSRVVRRLDVVSSFRLLHGQTVEGALVIPHEAESRACVWVVELAATEVRGDTAAAIDAHGPEVVGGKLFLSVHDRSHTVQIQILETHGLPHVQTCAIRKVDSARIHQLLTLLPG